MSPLRDRIVTPNLWPFYSFRRFFQKTPRAPLTDTWAAAVVRHRPVQPPLVHVSKWAGTALGSGFAELHQSPVTGYQGDSPRHRCITYGNMRRWKVRGFDMSDIPETGFLRLPQVLSVIPLGKTSWWEGVRSGRFPKPIKLSARCTAWRAEDIHELIRTLSDRAPMN